MKQIIAVSKKGRNALTSTNPNDFLFHSSYNTFKIVEEGVKTITLIASTANQSFTQTHGLTFIPLVAGFCKVAGDTKIYPPNTRGVSLASDKSLIDNGVAFNYIQADATNIAFNFDNDGAEVIVSVRYYCLEII